MDASDQDFLKRHRLTVDEYYRMAEVGLLAPDARVELIEGEIFDMAPIGTRHAGVVKQLLSALQQAVDRSAVIAVQDPLRLGDRSEPQPDLMLLKPSPAYYKAAHPTPSDVLLLIEVSHSSSRYDLEIKLPAYARYGVQEVWIVDLDNNVMRFYRNPAGEAYVDESSTTSPQRTAIQALPGVQADLTGLLD